MYYLWKTLCTTQGYRWSIALSILSCYKNINLQARISNLIYLMLRLFWEGIEINTIAYDNQHYVFMTIRVVLMKFRDLWTWSWPWGRQWFLIYWAIKVMIIMMKIFGRTQSLAHLILIRTTLSIKKASMQLEYTSSKCY